MPITIDVKNDLEEGSALKAFLTSTQEQIFTLSEELATFANLPVKRAAAAKPTTQISLSAPGKWTTTNGIVFALAVGAKCTICIDTASTSFSIAESIEDMTKTTPVSAGPSVGIVYVNIDLDFDIQGSAGGEGTSSGIGVSAKVSGKAAKTLTFCQPVDEDINTLAAIKKAFSHLIFPLDPTCMEKMQRGTIAKVSFDGSLECELDVTYGLGNYKLAASSLAAVSSSQKALGSVVKVTVPALEVDLGIKGALTYSHADHFAIVVNKITDATAMLYLVRSSENDAGGSIGISAGVTVTAASVDLTDHDKLAKSVEKVTGNSGIAQQVVGAASKPANNLLTSLNGKLKRFSSDDEVGLKASLSRHKGHVALFVFAVDLGEAGLVNESWSALVGGSVAKAMSIGGFTLQPGSGVSDSLKRTAKIQFQFFNLFKASITRQYFSDARTELAPDGTIRVFMDIGEEQDNAVGGKSSVFRIHFVAEATDNAQGLISEADVALHLELSESGNPNDSATLAHTIGLIPADPIVQDAQHKMVNYAVMHPKGTLNLVAILKRGAYGRLSYTPFVDNKPVSIQEQDNDNWNAFQKATLSLKRDIAPFVRNLSYDKWSEFNVDMNDQPGSRRAPNRKEVATSFFPGAVPEGFFTSVGASRTMVSFFLNTSAQFMNLCEDLAVLAKVIDQVQTQDQMLDLKHFLETIVKKDVSIDLAKPTVGALLYLCSIGKATAINAVVDSSADASSLTCTLILS